ncbi:HD family phosphohydrolase [Viridibacillus arvi]|uniref:HD family phosphohydrolase n=1 Tax=Viridibacillus arvi TaxID=263475 RepID=UPI00187B7F1D|nr:HDIG domain-containing metalloprotein [Viridibacillus sp. JNUCC-6]QOV12734.1 HDIG domain-containing protein [Viridibacillus sp. JNUCC-6]
MDAFLKKLIQYFRFPVLLAVILTVTGILQFSLMLGNVRGEHFDLKLFQLSPDTIRSMKTVEDTVKTEEDREQAASSVKPVFHYSEEIAKNRASMIKSIFDYVLEVKTSIEEGKTKKEKEAVMQDRVAELREKLIALKTDGQGLRFTDQELTALLEQDNDSLRVTRDELTELVKKQLSEPIRTDHVAEVKAKIDKEIREKPEFPDEIRATLVSIGRFSITETETENPDLTKEQIEQAKANVDPTRILQGQIIVQEGQVIDRDVYRELELTGMLADHTSTKPIMGLLLLISLQMTFFYAIFRNWKADKMIKVRDLIITVTIYLLSIVVMELLSLIKNEFEVMIGFLYPVAMAPMLIRLLVNERIAIIITIMTGVAAGVIFQEGYATVIQMEVSLYIIFGGLSSLFFSKGIEKRSRILQTSMGIALVNATFIGFYLLLTQSTYGMTELAYYLVASIVSALLSGALTLGLLPFIESAFGILSSFRLIELSSPNHPLLKKILVETPGTYHHSVMVANLADAACEAIGADGLLARVGCYYHDIGKTKRPGFFVENQMGAINPHDSLPAETSRDIIIAHAEDGAKMLEAYKMPKEIIDIARQHHGTSLLKFFYYKEKEKNPAVIESNYRYPGPKPQTKEVAIISVADSVEAAVRSMKEPTAEKIQKLVHAIAQDKLQDGQFDECDLSVRELKKIEAVFCETLNGIFHSRIEYPKPK